MSFEYIIYTPMMENDKFVSEINDVIEILNKHKISGIGMYFGWSWGDWESFDTSVKEIQNNIRKQEENTSDRFPGNDVYITITELTTEILFCHEKDIHIEFNKVNAVVSDIITSWNNKGIIHCVRKNKVDIRFEDIIF